MILTNADTGAAILRPFLRRLVEVLYDGRPEAMAEIEAMAASLQAQASALQRVPRLAPSPSCS